MIYETTGSLKHSNGAEMAVERNGAARAFLDNAQPDIQSCDWDCLFDAVTERLRATVGGESVLDHAGRRHDIDSLAQQAIGECVEALQQLHRSLDAESTRRRKLEAELLTAQNTLGEALVALAGTSPGELRARRAAPRESLAV